MTSIRIPWKTYFYYRNRLSGMDREIYQRLFVGLASWAPEIPLPYGCNIHQVADVQSLLLRDFPMYFHVAHTFRFGLHVFYPEYHITHTEYEKYYRQIVQFSDSCHMQFASIRPYDKVRSIHNSIVRHVAYFGRDEPDSHNIIGTMLKKKAVCESMSKTFKLLCDVNQIPCIVVFGTSEDSVLGSPGLIQNSSEVNHAWNKVRLGHNWYNVDVTFDQGISHPFPQRHVRYDYFCRSDQVFSVNHLSDRWDLPISSQDHNIYKALKRHFTSANQLKHAFRVHAHNGSGIYDFSYEPSLNLSTSDIISVVQEALFALPYTSFQIFHNENLCIASILCNV